jgi:hypothetical protein
MKIFAKQWSRNPYFPGLVLLLNEQLSYRLKGKIRLGGNDFASVLPFSSEGSLSIKNLVD